LIDSATAASIATIIGSLAAVIRWLLQVWHKQQAEIEKMKESVITRTLNELERAVGEHRKVLNQTTHEIKELQGQMTKVASVGVKVQEKWTVVSSRLEEYIEQNQLRTDKLEAELLSIGKDLWILKSGRPTNEKTEGN
jgi:chromosome segregation ATPase